MRVLGAVAIAALAGCTSVKVVQRDGCWVRRTERSFWRATEEVGPCRPPRPTLADDRLTRLVQECAAQADYRWEARATEAWMRGEAYPPFPQDETLKSCMEESRVGLTAENERLKEQLHDVSADRETLRQGSEKDRAHLRASHDRLTEYLGEAAKRPPGTAYATSASTSDSSASNESGTQLAAESRASPAAPVQPVDAARAPARPPKRARELHARRTSPRAGAPSTPPCACPPALPSGAEARDGPAPGTGQ